MTEFKAGDVVVYLDDTATPGQVTLGVPKVVKSVSPCGRYLRVLRDDNGEVGGYYATDFAFAHEQDDLLPPAPESVLYNARAYHGCNLEVVSLKANEYYDARIRIGVRNNGGARQGKVTCLTPDAALQLAHDLNRMANEIKRRERARSGE